MTDNTIVIASEASKVKSEAIHGHRLLRRPDGLLAMTQDVDCHCERSEQIKERSEQIKERSNPCLAGRQVWS